MIPSLRSYGLFGLGAIAVVALAQRFPVDQVTAVMLLYDLGLLVLMGMDGNRARRQRATLARLPLGRLAVGRDNPVTMTVTAGNFPARLRVCDRPPSTFPVSTRQFHLDLAPHAHQELTYMIRPDRRGVVPWGNLQGRQVGPWGLAAWDWQESAATEVAVYPDLIGLRSLSIRLALQNTGTFRQARTLGQGTEFQELREYRTGDDLRLIDWKATARRSQPLVRVLEPEREQTLIILLDQGRLMTAQVQGLQRFDWGMNAALALAMAGLSRGDRVGIGVFDKTLNTWLPPECGNHRLAPLIERLTPLQPTFTEPDYFGTVQQIIRHQSRRALIVLLTDIIDRTASAELLAALTRLTPRYLPFCVTLRDPQVDRCAHQTATTLPAAYEQAIALDLLAQRQAVFATLKQQGVLVLDAPADRITEPLIDQYLRLKTRSRL
ncbi:DUF58 domain-containing protein [Spirulina major]|uniref:DUF58 domain-containing protein n=1 Tax=Spirulina major TaxID=270636 RepID=UPI000933ED5E